MGKQVVGFQSLWLAYFLIKWAMVAPDLNPFNQPIIPLGRIIKT